MPFATRLLLGLLVTSFGVPVTALCGDAPERKEPGAEELVNRLTSSSYQEREAAAKALRSFGAKAVPALNAGLKGSSPEGVQRCKRVLADIRKDDLDRFLKAFAADKEGKATFDHPVWVRWAKVVGEDRYSRELLTEVLAAPGAAETLDQLEADPKAAGAIYPAELARLRAVADKRILSPDGKVFRPLSRCYSIGEASFGVYLGSYPGASSVKMEIGRGVLPLDPEMEMLESLSHIQYHMRGPWSEEFMKNGRYQSANLPLDGPKGRLIVASLLNLKNPRAIDQGLRSDDSLRHAQGDMSFALPLVRMVCREKPFPIEVRAASWPYLAEAGETDHLPDIVAGQTDKTRVQQFWRSDEGKREYLVLVSDVSIACQLIMHKQAPRDFGFIDKLNEARQSVDRSCFAYGFPDDTMRQAAHDKALAFLAKAPAPKGKK